MQPGYSETTSPAPVTLRSLGENRQTAHLADHNCVSGHNIGCVPNESRPGLNMVLCLRCGASLAQIRERE
jgi:hypothetical protein